MLKARFSYKHPEPKVDYTYLKDTRTDDEYKQFVEAGWKNEEILMSALKEIYEKEGFVIDVEFLNTAFFSKDLKGIDSYKPDVEVSFTKSGKTKKRKYEIKTTDKDWHKYLDVKAYQVETLYKYFPGTYLLFSTPTKFMSLSIADIYIHGEKIKSQFMGGKECYRMWLPALADKWKYYDVPLEFVPYPGHKTD